MSALVIPVLRPQPARMPLRTMSPRLRLVGPFEGVCAPTSIRLTRRGRLVMTLVVAVAVAALAVVLATSVDAAAPQIDGPHINYATVVLAGQTLSEVAAAQLPGLPINDAVARIQLVNGMNTSQVSAGQLLLIPELP
jgi:hypothetical protein